MRRQSEKKSIDPEALVRQFINDLNVDLYFGQILDWVQEDYGYYASLCDSETECHSIDDTFTAKMVKALMDAAIAGETYAEDELKTMVSKLARTIAHTINTLKSTRSKLPRTRVVDACINEIREAVKPVLDQCVGIFIEHSDPSMMLEEVRGSADMPIPSFIEESLQQQYSQLYDLRWLAADNLENMLCNENFERALRLLEIAIRKAVE